MRTAIVLLVFLFPLYGHAAQSRRNLFFWTLTPEQVTRHVRDVPASDAQRLSELRQIFLDEQCPRENLKEKNANLWCVLPGDGQLTLVVAAHYERHGKGVGTIDDWSGAVLIPMLYKSLTAEPRKHTILFVELAGDKGAGKFLAQFTKAERRRIAALIELDSLGMGNTAYFTYPDPPGDQIDLAEDRLILLMYASARMLGTVEPPVGFDSRLGLKYDQTQRFRWDEIPSITVHSISRATMKIPGSALDIPEMLHEKSYYKSYQLLSAYIAYTDLLLDKLATDDHVWPPH